MPTFHTNYLSGQNIAFSIQRESDGFFYNNSSGTFDTATFDAGDHLVTMSASPAPFDKRYAGVTNAPIADTSNVRVAIHDTNNSNTIVGGLAGNIINDRLVVSCDVQGWRNTTVPIPDTPGIPEVHAAGSSGPGADEVTITVTVAGNPVADADVWITSDAAGTTVVAGTLQTDSNGQATFLLDAGSTYYLWVQKDGINSIQGQSFVAVAD